MSGTLRLILGDQLTDDLPAITDAVKSHDVILLAEVREEATYVKHHKKKIAFLFSAMRHFAKELESQGYTVRYRYYDDKDNQGSLLGEVKLALDELELDNVVTTAPGEYRLLKSMQQWEHQLSKPVTINEDTRFYATPTEFSEWAEGRKSLRMEFFYREMRKKTGILMQDGGPVGGQWNYDAKNRESLPESVQPPSPSMFEPDDITLEVIELVKNEFANHFGDIDEFHYAITRQQALEVLNTFIE